jgi:alkanesulfonate monooxygenase SsuD/methylene tetrahydromethanopterin reductase-like flavin-dependent oxidoreductase (luciferase family)
VAERAAMLDLLSGGRLDLGGGRGGLPHELSLFGVDGDTTTAEVEEALRMIGHMWQSETFEWDGMLEITPHAVVPRPMQEPHPPLFLACTKHETVVRAAELGVGALVLGFAGPDEIAVTRKLYSDGIASRTGERLVSTVVNDHFSALCTTVVLDDGEAARRIGLRGQRFFQESSGHYSRGGPQPSADTEDEDNEQAILAIEQSKREATAAELNVANVRYSTDNAYGDVRRAIDHVTVLQELGVDEVMCLVQMGTVPHSACLETLRHWGEEILPRFR